MGHLRIAICIGLILASSLMFDEARAALPDDIRVTLNPSSPNPGDTVAITLESYTTDLNQAEITWWINGSVARRGRGEKGMQVEAPALGKSMTIVVSANTLESGTIEKNIVISPARVAILWQARAYTPPFYKGKALAPSESAVTAVAVPDFLDQDGRRIKTSDIVFTWKRNGTVAGSQSGLGKDSYTFTNGRLPGDEPTVQVEASAPTQNLQATAAIRVPLSSPKIVFYEESPLRGVLLHNALPGTFPMDKNEMTIVAYPYFAESIAGDNISTSWRLNGNSVEPVATKNSITVRSPGASGTASLSFSLQNLSKLFETASKSLSIQFGTNNRPRL